MIEPLFVDVPLCAACLFLMTTPGARVDIGRPDGTSDMVPPGSVVEQLRQVLAALDGGCCVELSGSASMGSILAHTSYRGTMLCAPHMAAAVPSPDQLFAW